eukprot:354069-Chlamydomonas_euryale.AAC.9
MSSAPYVPLGRVQGTPGASSGFAFEVCLKCVRGVTSGSQDCVQPGWGRFPMVGPRPLPPAESQATFQELEQVVYNSLKTLIEDADQFKVHLGPCLVAGMGAHSGMGAHAWWQAWERALGHGSPCLVAGMGARTWAWEPMLGGRHGSANSGMAAHAWWQAWERMPGGWGELQCEERRWGWKGAGERVRRLFLAARHGTMPLPRRRC